MAARAIWKGVIRFGGVSVAVKVFSAVQDRRIHFRLLHEKDRVPVEQRMVDPRSGKPVPSEAIQRGYEISDGEFVVLTKEDLAELAPESSRDIIITRFVDPSLINHQWYDRPYYLGPDGTAAQYAALSKALEKEDKEGVASWTMRKKRYVGALSAENGRLKLITLRHAEEVIDASQLPRPKGRKLAPQEVEMAGQLVSALEGDFEPGAYRETYRDRLLDLIDKKARGVKPMVKKARKPKPETDRLAETLKKSLVKIEKERKRA